MEFNPPYSDIGEPTERNREPQVFLKPVETFHCAPDDSGYIGQRIDTYFDEVLQILDYNQRAREVFVNREYMTPCFESGATLNPTDNTIVYLHAQDKLIAFAMEARTAYNYIDVAVVCTLTPELLAQLQRNEALLNTDHE